MKYFIVLALCLSAVAAEELNNRHNSQHHQTIEEAKRKAYNVLDGQHAEFEEVDHYGGLGGVGVGTLGFSGRSGSEFASNAGSNAEFSSAAGSSHSANFASSSSFGSNANYASGAHGSGSLHSGAQGSGSIVIPVLGGSGSSSYLDGSAAENVQQKDWEFYGSGGVGGQERIVHDFRAKEQIPRTNLLYTYPSAAMPIQLYNVPSTSGSKNYIHHEERHGQTQSSAPIIQFAPSTSGSENYVHHESHRVENQAVPNLSFIAPSGGSEKYYLEKQRIVQNQAVPLIHYNVPSGGQESFLKYRKVTTTASQPQVLISTVPSTSSSFIHQSSTGSTSGSQLGSLVTGGLTGTHSGSTSGSQLGSLVTGGLTGTHSGYDNGFYVNPDYTVPSNTFGSSNSLIKTGFGASHESASNFGTSSTFGAGHQSGFGLNTAGIGSESSFGASGSASGLHNYMQESERLARLQAQGMSIGGTRTGGSQLVSNSQSANAAGFGGFGGLAAVGAGNAGYKAKSWEKASKWSSQSEFGSDGHVNNFKELSTGESENYDINGHRAGYKAATTTLDDNGKVSSYSLHT